MMLLPYSALPVELASILMPQWGVSQKKRYKGKQNEKHDHSFCSMRISTIKLRPAPNSPNYFRRNICIGLEQLK
jgi:hypothetical protein